MNGAGQFVAVLGQLSRWKHLGDGFRGSRNRVDWAEAWPYLVAALAIATTVTALIAYRRHYDFARRTNDPPRLFRELCAIHQLNRTHRTLLWRLAESLEYAQPAQVFLTPSAFQPANLPATLQKHAATFAMLRERLF